jgi:hypothetical protein
MQEWTRSGTPVPAIGEDHVLLGTPIIGWGPLFEIHKPHPRTLKVLLPPLKEMVLHNPWQMEIQRTASKDYSHSPPQKKARPASKITDATLVMYPPASFA